MPPSNEDVARAWRAEVVSSADWVPAANQAGANHGECGGLFVTTAGFDRRAYLKPAKAERWPAPAAKEKIASDLAFELGLPVPPAVLYSRPGGDGAYPSEVVLSLVMYARQWPWETIRNQPQSESPLWAALTKVFGVCSGMLAFDTWVGQADHGDHPHNIIWGYDPPDYSTSRVLFLDFVRSMGWAGDWNNGGWKNLSKIPYPLLLQQHVDKNLLSETAEAIRVLPEATIKEIVYRIPETHLTTQQKDLIFEGLVGRQSLLADAIQKGVLVA